MTIEYYLIAGKWITDVANVRKKHPILNAISKIFMLTPLLCLPQIAKNIICNRHPGNFLKFSLAISSLLFTIPFIDNVMKHGLFKSLFSSEDDQRFSPKTETMAMFAVLSGYLFMGCSAFSLYKGVSFGINKMRS